MNVVVVSFERLPVGCLGCYGNFSVRTPSFDRLASESIVFDQHFGENFDPHAANHAWWTGRYQFPRTYDQQAAAASIFSLLESRGVQTQLLDLRPSDTPESAGVDASLDSWQGAPDEAQRLLWLRFPGPCWSDAGLDEYAEQVEQIDAVLGAVLDRVNSAAAQPPVVIVTAGQGEVVLTRDDQVEEESSLHEELVHVPLIIRLPGSDQAGSRRQALTQSVDIAPTLAEWFGVDFAEADFEGASLLPLTNGDESTTHSCVFMGNGPMLAVRDREFCLVRSGTGALRLFLKPEDRYEQADAAREYPAVVEDLEAALDEFLARFGGDNEAPPENQA